MMLGTVRPVPSAFTGPFHLGKVGCGAFLSVADTRTDGRVAP
jgi:hypothetical protein